MASWFNIAIAMQPDNYLVATRIMLVKQNDIRYHGIGTTFHRSGMQLCQPVRKLVVLDA